MKISFTKFPDTLTIVVSVLLLFVGLTWIIPAGEYERGYSYKLDEAWWQKLNASTNLAAIAPKLQTLVPATYIGQAELERHLRPALGDSSWQVHADEIAASAQFRRVVIPDTYRAVEASPQTFWHFLLAPIRGFENAVLIIGFVFLVGGAFGMVNSTGAIEAGLSRTVAFSRRHPSYKNAILPLLMTLFSLAGATFGMSEEVLVFILITIPLAIALGYDSIVGVAVPFIGAGAGFAGAFSNPFTIGVAQGISNLPLFSGWEYRLVVWAVLTAGAIVYVMLYARRIARHPESGPMFDIDRQREASTDELERPFGWRHKLVLFNLFAALVLLIVGVTRWDWYIHEIAALFLGMGLVAVLVFRLPAATASAAFMAGAKDMMMAALVIAFTNGLLAVATDGKIIDTILHTLAGSASGLPQAISIQVMFVFQGVLNFFMPSGSGQAALTMPIMAPLSDLLGISRQTAVLAFQLGDGLFNMIIPTSGVTMGILAIARIPYNKWFAWAWPLMLLFLLLGMLVLLPPTLGWVEF